MGLQGIVGIQDKRKEQERLDLANRLQQFQLGQEYGPDAISSVYGQPSRQPTPLKMFSPSQPGFEGMTALPGMGDYSQADQAPASPYSDPNLMYPKSAASRRLKFLQDAEDRNLNKQYKESEIQKNLRGPSVSFQKAEYLDAKGRARVGRFNPQSGMIEKSEMDPMAPQTARGETAGNLRKEFIDRPETKDFQNINTQVKSMDSLLNRALSGDINGKNFLDQSLITIFNKINDPSSVVRESEYARTPEGLALANRLQGSLEKISQGGAGLTDQDRTDLVSAAKIIANSRGSTYSQTRGGYVNLAQQMSLDPSLITATMPEFTPYQINSATRTNPGQSPLIWNGRRLKDTPANRQWLQQQGAQR